MLNTNIKHCEHVNTDSYRNCKPSVDDFLFPVDVGFCTLQTAAAALKCPLRS